MALPPGPTYIFRILPFLLVPPVTVFAFFRWADYYQKAAIPVWVYITGILLARPAFSVFDHYQTLFAERKAAAARNAFNIPRVEEQWPSFAGISLLKLLIEDFKIGYPGDMFLDWKEKYGNIYQTRLFSDVRIVTFEPDHVKAVLATQFDAFHKGPLAHSQFDSLLGTGVFNSDGDMWKFHRTMTRPFFTRERITDFEVFDTHADSAFKLAKGRLAEGCAIDMQDLVSRFTLDSATQFLFGHDVESLSAGLPYPTSSRIPNPTAFLNHPSNIFVDAFLQGQDLAAIRTRTGPLWALSEFWGDKIKPLRKIMDNFTEPLLLEALEKKNATAKDDNKDKDEADETLLSHLVQQTDDINVLKDELINLLVAGRDTTACTLTFASYMLAENPKIAQRLRQEVLDKVGPTSMPTYDDIRDMKYLRAFVNEVLRLYPPVPFDSRSACKETVLTTKAPDSKPYYVPNNARVLYSIFHIHRRTDLWGPDALEFDPDRFLDERLHKYLTPNPFIFCPFNAGPRICLGQQYAYQESSFFLVRLLQQFTNFRLAPEAQPQESKAPASWAGCGNRKSLEKIRPGMHLTMYAKGGMWMYMDQVKTE